METSIRVPLAPAAARARLVEAIGPAPARYDGVAPKSGAEALRLTRLVVTGPPLDLKTNRYEIEAGLEADGAGTRVTLRRHVRRGWIEWTAFSGFGLVAAFFLLAAVGTTDSDTWTFAAIGGGILWAFGVALAMERSYFRAERAFVEAWLGGSGPPSASSAGPEAARLRAAVVFSAVFIAVFGLAAGALHARRGGRSPKSEHAAPAHR